MFAITERWSTPCTVTWYIEDELRPNFLPLQDWPLPVKPLPHSQLNEPGTFWHVALTWQLSGHSSISKSIQNTLTQQLYNLFLKYLVARGGARNVRQGGYSPPPPPGATPVCTSYQSLLGRISHIKFSHYRIINKILILLLLLSGFYGILRYFRHVFSSLLTYHCK